MLTNWAYRLFTYQRGTRIIIQPYINADDKVGQEFARQQAID